MFERPHHDNRTWRPPEDQRRKKDSGHQRRAAEAKGRHSHSTIDHRVVFAVGNTFLKMFEPGDKGSERLLPLCLHTFVGLVTLISAFAPTLTSIPEAKDLPERYHQEHPQQESPCPPWRLQRQCRCRPWVLVFLLGLFWSWQDKRERAAPVGALLSSWPLPNQLLFADEATTQNVMVPLSI